MWFSCIIFGYLINDINFVYYKDVYMLVFIVEFCINLFKILN